jgi:uncharacterized membrane protein
MAGVFFAFSTFVMNALARLPPAHGIAAMQSINIVVINPLFMTVFMGTALTSVIFAIASLLRWQSPRSAYLLTGSVLYLAGTFLVTIVFNVPLNNALAVVDPTSADAASTWSRYLSGWTAWNHVRTVAAVVASASFALALRSG